MSHLPLGGLIVIAVGIGCIAAIVGAWVFGRRRGGRAMALILPALLLVVLVPVVVIAMLIGVRVETRERVAVQEARARAPAERAKARALVEHDVAAIADRGYSIVKHVPDAEDFDRWLVDRIDTSPRVAGGKLFVGSYATQVYMPGTEPPQPGVSPNNPGHEHIAALHGAVESDIVANLGNYLFAMQRARGRGFELPVAHTLPRFRNQADAHALARRIVAKLPIGDNQTVLTRDQTTGEYIRFFAREVRIDQDLIQQALSHTAASPGAAAVTTRRSTWVMIIGLSLVLIVAGILLKAATRRHVQADTV